MADVDLLALTIIGSSHLLFASRDGNLPPSESVHDLVTSVIAGIVTGH